MKYLVSLLIMFIFDDKNHVKSGQNSCLKIDILRSGSGNKHKITFEDLPRQDCVLRRNGRTQGLLQQGHLSES